jgi:hypothetical protein
MLRLMQRLVIFIFVLLTSFFVHAQSEGGGQSGLTASQVGGGYGFVLPNGVDGANEIFAMWTGYYAMPIGSKGQSHWEFGGVYSDDEGVEWMGAYARARMNIPIETLVGIAFIGLDYSDYSAPTGSDTAMGGHLGGGLMSLIGSGTYARFDMKLNSKPGTSLYFNLGIVFDMDGKASGGAD